MIIATGSKNRLAAARDLYSHYAFHIDGINPEKAYSVKESMSPDVGMVASQKTDAILNNLRIEVPTLVMGSDVATWTWKHGRSEQDAVEMKKAIREDTDDKTLIAEKMREVAVTARHLYCNGAFYVRWDVGIVLKTSNNDYARGVVVECFADFPMGLNESIVEKQTALERSVFDNSIVNLAELVSTYGANIRIRNRGETGEGESILPRLAELLVVGGVLPHALFSQFLTHEGTQKHLTETGTLAYDQVNLRFAHV